MNRRRAMNASSPLKHICALLRHTFPRCCVRLPSPARSWPRCASTSPARPPSARRAAAPPTARASGRRSRSPGRSCSSRRCTSSTSRTPRTSGWRTAAAPAAPRRCSRLSQALCRFLASPLRRPRAAATACPRCDPARHAPSRRGGRHDTRCELAPPLRCVSRRSASHPLS